MSNSGTPVTYIWDHENRLTVGIYSGGSVRNTYTYDGAGRPTLTIDAAGYRHTTIYDNVNRVEATIDPLGNRTTNTYDATGALTEVLDANGKRTTYVYDDAGRQQASVNALANRVTFTYDALGGHRHHRLLRLLALRRGSGADRLGGAQSLPVCGGFPVLSTCGQRGGCEKACVAG